MRTRHYGQYCGIAHALEIVGDRWALLLVRDLIRRPKRFTDLQRGLPRIPSNVLSTRLKELEDAGVIRRRALPRPAGGVGYELTEYGRELEDIVMRLGAWGARSLGEPRPGDTVTADQLLLGLEAAFRPEAARGLSASFELDLGQAVVQLRVEDGVLELDEGPLADADLRISTDLTFHRLMTGELRPAEALESGKVRVEGDPDLLARFVEIFHTPVAPVATPA